MLVSPLDQPSMICMCVYNCVCSSQIHFHRLKHVLMKILFSAAIWMKNCPRSWKGVCMRFHVTKCVSLEWMFEIYSKFEAFVRSGGR